MIKTSVDICIATYKRPNLLEQLLNSLLQQSAINEFKVRIIIIDNDPEKSAQIITSQFFKNCELAHIYDVQSEKNISLTRNRAIQHSSADYLAFIDDDEWADHDWLKNLLFTSIFYDSDVVFGKVIYCLPDDAPEWVRKGGYFKKTEIRTGDFRQYGASNNALIRNTDKVKKVLGFSPEFGLTGGEDTDMFYRFHLNGFKLVSCNEAVVYESVTKDRLNVMWLVKRAFRSGQVFAKIFNKNQTILQSIEFIFKRLMYLFIATIAFVVLLPFGKSKWVWALQKLMANAGQLTMLISDKPYQGYK